MPYANVRTAVCALGLLVVLLGGCARSKPTRFYMLTPSPGSELAQQEWASTGQLVIGIGPVKFPEYLDRPQIVSRTNGNRLTLAEFDRWAEPLPATTERVLGQELSALLATHRVILHPWDTLMPVELQVRIDVLCFERWPTGDVVLDVRWVLYSNGEPQRVTRDRLTATPADEGYDALAAAHSDVLAQLGRRMAEGIVALGG